MTNSGNRHSENAHNISASKTDVKKKNKKKKRREVPDKLFEILLSFSKTFCSLK